MDDHGPRVADYFVLTGLTEDSKPLDEEIQNEGHIKPQRNLAPITDIHVIIRSQGEKVPPGFTCIEQTPFGFQADLNNGCIGSPSVFLCYKRGYDKPPLTDIGILYEGKSRLMEGCEVLSSTPTGLPANVNSRIGVSSQRAYITYRKAKANSRHNTLAVIDIAVILTNKGEAPPHAFNLINKNLNKGSMVGNDVYLCYKKSAIRGNSLVYEPALLSRYPPEDYPEFSLPDSVSKFCMPLGATLECWPSTHTHPLPLFSTFVLTDQGGAKVYGAGVTFYESYPESKLTEQQRESFNMKESQSYGIHTNKCICILSRWPFFDAFKKFLTFIYRLSLSGPLTVPIERYIAHFMHEVPFPTPQRPRIFMQLGHSSLILAQPQTSPLPLSGASFCALLQNLGPETCLNLLTYVLLESKILLHSLRPALLTAVAEAVSSMIFPFVWQCPYVPLCPLFLAMTLNAPFPVIFGIDSRYFDTYDPPSDATCVDIDTNTILLPDDKKGMNWKILPKKPAKKLLNMLSGLYREVLKSGISDSVSDDLAVEMAPLDDDFNKKKKQTILELKIQDAFLIFMASIMKDYNKYLLPITQQPTQRVTDADARFDCNGFIKSRDKASHVFFKQLSKTQQFIKLVEDVSFVTEHDERFAFFEECTERVDAESKEDVKLIDYEAVHDSEHTVFVTPPDETELEGMEFDYQGFPVLNPALFLPSGSEGNVANRSSRNVFNSPFPRRTKQEMRQSQKMAKLQASSPEQWASYLLSQCYALWFLHLPSYVQGTHSKTRALKASFEVLKKIQGKNLHLVDEVCYRILMQLCGQYSQPVLAVQVFMEMRQRDVKINAITYGYYNKAVLESRWPASSFSGYQQWVKLRHTLLAVAQFKRPLKRRSYSDNSDVVSRSSGDSVDAEGRTEETPSATCTLTREEKSSTGNPNLLVDTGPSSNTSTPVNTTDNNSTLTNSLMEADNTPKKVTVSRNSSIVRKTRASSGSTSSVGRGNSVSGLDDLLKSGETPTDRSVFDDFDSGVSSLHSRRRHHSEDSWTLSSLHAKSNGNVSHVSPSPNKSSGSSSPSQWKKELFKGDAGIIEGLTGADPSSGPERTKPSMIKEMETSGHVRSSSLGSKPFADKVILPPEKTDPLQECNHIDHLDPEEENEKNKQKVEKSSKDSDLLITFDDGGAGDSKEAAKSIDQIFQSSSTVEHKTCPVETNHKDSFDSLDSEDLLSNSKKKPLSAKASGESDGSEQTGSPRSTSPSDSKESLPSAFKRTKTRQSFLSSFWNTSGLSPHVSKESISKKLFAASTQMESLGSSMKSKTIDLAAKVGEYTRSFSSSSVKDNESGTKSPATGSLIDLDTLSETGDDKDSASILQEKLNTDESLEDLGIILPSFKGSSQSLNNPSSDQEDIGRRMYAMEVTMSSCCRCSQCRCLVYDEAIIAGWSADESKFQTSCCFCRAQWVPSLTMSIVDNRDQALRTRMTQSPSSESVQSIQSAPFLKTEDNAQLSNDDELGGGQRSNPSIDNLSYGSEGDLLSSGPAISSKKEESKQKEQMASDEQSDMDTVGPLLNLSGNENGLKDDKHGDSRRSRSSSESGPGDMSRRGSVPDKKSSSGLKAATSYSLPRYVKGIDEMDFHLSTSSLPTNIKGSRENIPLPRKDTEVSPVSVPYLSPLVLWKEVENVIENEGETCLKSPSFVSEHPIIFWNLVWYFNRLDLPNYMGGLLLAAYSELKGKTSHHLSTFTRYVKIHTMWENTQFWVELGPPMYMLWMSIGVVPSPFETRGFTKAFMLQIVKCIRYDNVHIPITMLLDEYKRLGVEKCERRGIYHDLLFLTFTALGRENIDQEAFDIKYRSACEKLPAEYKNQMQYDDSCPPMAVRMCNLTFGDLSLRTTVASKD